MTLLITKMIFILPHFLYEFCIKYMSTATVAQFTYR
jgi:hypothetical protein